MSNQQNKGNTMSLFTSILSPLSSLASSWSERRTTKLKGKIKLEEAKWDLKVARVKSKAQEVMIENTRDFDYDLQVLKNRNNTIADEIIICLWVVVFALHFIPSTQGLMASGWEAMGYHDSLPWWFEFGMVGILVSTLGLMRVLKLWASMFGRRPVNGKGSSAVKPEHLEENNAYKPEHCKQSSVHRNTL
jgi:hypothetical protein